MSVTTLGPLAEGGVQLPFYSFKVPAGFPSPAADHLEQHISIDELLDIRAPHIYLVRIEGHSMEGAGIFDGDMAVVDRSITAEHGHIVIAAVNCEPVCIPRVSHCCASANVNGISLPLQQIPQPTQENRTALLCM